MWWNYTGMEWWLWSWLQGDFKWTWWDIRKLIFVGDKRFIGPNVWISFGDGCCCCWWCLVFSYCIGLAGEVNGNVIDFNSLSSKGKLFEVKFNEFTLELIISGYWRLRCFNCVYELQKKKNRISYIFNRIWLQSVFFVFFCNSSSTNMEFIYNNLYSVLFHQR